MFLTYCFAIFATFWWHSRSHTYKKSHFLLHLSNPLSSIHQFSPCLSRSPLQSSCQPATSFAVAMAASWQETAPSVSVGTALRSGRMERAAKVGFSCTGEGGNLHWSGAEGRLPLPSAKLPSQEWAGEALWEPSVCRQNLVCNEHLPLKEVFFSGVNQGED